MYAEKHAQLVEWVSRAETNGIKQHSPEWHAAKVNTIGGSSLATIIGHNPYSTIPKMISEKVGLSKFAGDIKPRWGNLFEDVIKRYVEHDLRCEILGEDLFIEGPPGTAYSPDGLAVLGGRSDSSTPEILLIEFKCPFSRIPGRAIPGHYVPQLLMGLDVLGDPDHPLGAITERALFVEAVFRRSLWVDCGPSTAYNADLVKRTGASAKAGPLAFGINGFYQTDVDGGDFMAALSADFLEYYCEFGDSSNDYQSADIGDASVKLFTDMMEAYDRGLLRAWYGPVRVPSYNDAGKLIGNAHMAPLQSDLAAFEAFCAEGGYTNWGILPWKLFRVDYHHIDRVPGYLAPHLPKIREVLEVVSNARAQPTRARNICDAYERKCVGGFSDD